MTKEALALLFYAKFKIWAALCNPSELSAGDGMFTVKSAISISNASLGCWNTPNYGGGLTNPQREDSPQELRERADKIEKDRKAKEVEEKKEREEREKCERAAKDLRAVRTLLE